MTISLLPLPQVNIFVGFSSIYLLYSIPTGCTISWDGDFNTHTEGEVFASVIDLLLNCACFIYIGAWLPFQAFTIPEIGITPPKLVLLTVGILHLRRIPAILVLYKFIPEITSWKEAVFSGHFGIYLRPHGQWEIFIDTGHAGPMGVGAIFISTLALHKLPAPANPPVTQQDYLATALQPIVSFVVLASIIIRALSFDIIYILAFHNGSDGLSIPFFNLSRTLSLPNTLTRSSTRLYPEWLLGVKRTPTFPTQPEQMFSGPVPLPISAPRSEGIIAARLSALSLPFHQSMIVSVPLSSSKSDEAPENVESKRASVDPKPVSASEPDTQSPAEIMKELRPEVGYPTELQVLKAVHFPGEQ